MSRTPNTDSSYRLANRAVSRLLEETAVPIITRSGHVLHGKVCELYSLAQALHADPQHVYAAAARDPRIMPVCDESGAVLLALPEGKC